MVEAEVRRRWPKLTICQDRQCGEYKMIVIVLRGLSIVFVARLGYSYIHEVFLFSYVDRDKQTIPTINPRYYFSIIPYRPKLSPRLDAELNHYHAVSYKRMPQ
jgi:hypothetical protein